MSRATWEGQLAFGLINVPVALYSGVKTSEGEFNLLDARDQKRIRYVRVNEATGEEVPWDQIVHAYPVEDGHYVLLEKEDFERAAVKATRTLEVDGFIDPDEIDAQYYEKPYVLVPRPGGEKAYVLLREAMKGTRKVALARVVIRSRQYLLALIPQGNAIIAERMRFPQEIRNPEAFELPSGWMKEYGVSAQELAAAEKLVKAMSQDWQPQDYHDEYREALLDWIDKKIRTGEVSPELERAFEPEETENEDMLDLLEKSLEQAQPPR